MLALFTSVCASNQMTRNFLPAWRQCLATALIDPIVAQIDRLWTVNPRVSPLDCAPALALLGEIRALPPAQRKPAQRRLFD